MHGQRASSSAVLPARVPPCASCSSVRSTSTSEEMSAPLARTQLTLRLKRPGADVLLVCLGLRARCRESKRRARGLAANAMTERTRSTPQLTLISRSHSDETLAA